MDNIETGSNPLDFLFRLINPRGVTRDSIAARRDGNTDIGGDEASTQSMLHTFKKKDFYTTQLPLRHFPSIFRRIYSVSPEQE